LKWGLVNRGILDHATVRTPLLPLPEGAETEIAEAFAAANIGKVTTTAAV
jgi:4-hydroxy-tetrahydrodipicolinate synthase